MPCPSVWHAANTPQPALNVADPEMVKRILSTHQKVRSERLIAGRACRPLHGYSVTRAAVLHDH